MAPSTSFNRGLTLLVAASLFMENLDGTIIQTAAPAMARDFGVRAVDLNAAMTAYLLTVAVCIPVTGWLADRFGARRVFLTAIVVFTLASVLCAFSPSLFWLCVFRVLQGIGGAMMVPVGRLTVLRAVSKADLLDAMAYLTWPSLLAPVIAPALGGLITDTVGWSWIFWINLPIGAAVFLAGLALVPRAAEAGAAAARRRLDWPSLLGLGAALAMLTLGADLGSASGGATAFVLWLLVAAVGGVLVWFVLTRQDARPGALLDVRAMRLRTFRTGNAQGGVYRLMISAAPFLFTLLFQVGFGWSAAKAGLVVIAIFVGNLAIKPATSPLIRRFGFRAVILWSTAWGAAILAAFAFLDASTPLPVFLVLLLFSGVFRSTGFSGYNTIQFVDVPPEDSNGANTLASILQQLAAGLGIAVAAVLVHLGVGAAGALGVHGGAGYRWAFLGASALLLIPLVDAVRLPRDAGAAAMAARR